MPTLSRIAVHPIKSLDPQERDRVAIEAGGLVGDREYAIFDADGEYVNGKRTAAVHRIRSSVDLGDRTATIRIGDGDPEVYDLDDPAALEARLAEHFGYPVEVRRTDPGGFNDSSAGSGPTLISTATLEEVASWFPDIGVESIRRRFRANLEVEGVPPFWEDRLFAPEGEVEFRVGDVRLHGVKPVPRCVVPTRDPDTGEETPGFRETFLDRREATLPEWTPVEAFEHLYSLMVVTRIPDSAWGETLRVGDEVEVVGERPPA